MSTGRTSEVIFKSPGHALFYGDDPRREEKMKERERIKFCPHLHEVMYGKRYILPNYRQPDYYPQKIADNMFASALFVPMQTYEMDDVMNAALIGAIAAIKHGRPQLWLERELGEAFMRAELPEDMVAEDIQWRWGGFRVHLPKKLLHISDDQVGGHDLMFIDISYVPAKKRFGLPPLYAAEAEALGIEYNWDEPSRARTIETRYYDNSALVISGNLNGSGNGSFSTIENAKLGDFMVYAVIKPFDEAIRLGQLRAVSHESLFSPYENTPDDNRFCERILHLGIQILLYLGSIPLEYQTKERVIRKPKTEGKHTVPGLYAAKFVGASQLRPESKPDLPSVAAGTGRVVAAHCRAGHWTRQPYGPKRGLRKLIWIHTQWIHGEIFEEEILKGIK